MIYDDDDLAEYRSFKIVLDLDSQNKTPSNIFFILIDDFFEPDFLNSIYAECSLAALFEKRRFASNDSI
jgi:hypothetical protein